MIVTPAAVLSIHAPTRGATVAILDADVRQLFQSTLLQEERHADSHRGSLSSILSIHAPTRGATLEALILSLTLKLSIHAPTRGATAKMHNIPYASLQ